MRLTIVPCTVARAKSFVNHHHRHHSAKIQAIFCVAVVDELNVVRGVAMCGQPVARKICDGLTIEVNRVATDGCKNACSALLGACRRIAFDLGYRRIVTYTLHEEGGGSLRGAGWCLESESAGDSSDRWHTRANRSINMDNKHAIKCRWVCYNSKSADSEPIWPTLEDEDRQTSMFDKPTGRNPPQ